MYSAEINVGGKVIYGYNWAVRHVNTGPGPYRITFSLDSLPDLNTYFTPMTYVKPSDEVVTESDDDGGDTGGGVAYIDVENNLTYIDINIVPKETGGGGGGGPGGRRR